MINFLIRVGIAAILWFIFSNSCVYNEYDERERIIPKIWWIPLAILCILPVIGWITLIVLAVFCVILYMSENMSWYEKPKDPDKPVPFWNKPLFKQIKEEE